MNLGIYYVIRHKDTGEIMPALARNRGYSWWNPANNKLDPNRILGTPRILKSRKQASRVIVQWNSMPCSKATYITNYKGEVDDSIETSSDGRSKNDLEIVEVLIIEVKV